MERLRTHLEVLIETIQQTKAVMFMLSPYYAELDISILTFSLNKRANKIARFIIRNVRTRKCYFARCELER